ncbi:thioredoxin family protein [Chitinophagaceae bacterium LB-8]|uniref:Thioredoxin family protein n=1 Tax=Paraflavisolibacter caeni TaxID=2982496 RepID=A0A9X2XXE7_9BACT|nr:thioredoxin family protein [Paraflavisolibacter caeni]MCU7551081.1 thioredoxin family protein [Paraflavisolibacter caeni]
MRTMTKLLSVLFSLLLIQTSFAQNAEISRDGSGNKVVKGFISRDEITKDTAFKWFADNQKGYTPYAPALQAIKAIKDSINIIAFGGTWCDDTKFVLPRFYALTDAAGLSADRITFIGVDHSKKTLYHLSEAFNITNVPTLIVMKGGKEIGRVVEYGKTGMFEKDLGEILGKR